MFPEHIEQKKELKLNKVLYELRRLFLLWQQKLTNILKSLEFIEIPQELCIMQKNIIICFFFVHNIIFAFKKKKRNKSKQIVNLPSKTLIIKVIGELKWFFGLYIICYWPNLILWLLEKEYIQKIYNKLAPTDKCSTRFPFILIKTIKLLSIK